MSDGIDRRRVALADRYENERELGEGRMARAYLATDIRYPRVVVPGSRP